jgi:hypothetical protein
MPLEALIKEIREEPFHLLSNNCFHKSFRFKRRCRELGITARVVVCLGLNRAKWFGHWVTIPVLHAWGEVKRERIELGQPPGTPGPWETVGDDVEPLIAMWL